MCWRMPLFIRFDNVMGAFNAYYGGTRFLVPAIVLTWLLWRHPERYARTRTTLAVGTAVAFVIFWLFPVAPPRLLPARFGIVDTLAMASPAGHAEGALISAAGDQYASMPSLHVAWAVWCAVALYPVVRRRALRILAIAYPVMTALVVVATGNHYFLDGARPAVPGRVCGRGLGRPLGHHRFCAAMRPGRQPATGARPRPARAAAEHGQPRSG